MNCVRNRQAIEFATGSMHFVWPAGHVSQLPRRVFPVGDEGEGAGLCANSLEPALEKHEMRDCGIKSFMRGYACIVCVLFVGCFGDGRRPVFPVSGKVTFEGKPTVDALITFHPQNDPDPTSRPLLTRVSADGTYKLYTYEMDDGAPVGKYVVTVTWIKETDNQNAPKEEVRPAKNMVPERFAQPKTTPLAVEVKEQPNEFSFELSK